MLWSGESKFQIVLGNLGHRVLWTKKEKDHPDCYQCKVQKPASVMVWGCVSGHGMGNLHICEGTINAERYIQVLEQHMLPGWQHMLTSGDVFFRDVPAYFSKTMSNHILHMLQQCGFMVKECGY